MGISLNQADMTTRVGTLALAPSNPQPQAQIGSGETGTLKAGDFVKLTTSVNRMMIVVKASATDNVIGCIAYTPLKDAFVAGDMVSLAQAGDQINLKATGSITAGVAVVIDATNGGVKAYADPEEGETADTKVGVAINGGSSGDVIKVRLTQPMGL